ncbi:hypothetical protein [Nonomuraea sp. NEAU-A123]|uniref:hypothetical protein n=1 Tax=Nonomuraea sp. NEAU-A123 TaxID=2839649 RepID=UPI001BE473FD|nr:hypothetical protein [Nonomuraea sp. NEAU-A123]MBT2235384.1 hypothetical protein [Nonomuraea sp. NEAU-A123]
MRTGPAEADVCRGGPAGSGPTGWNRLERHSNGMLGYGEYCPFRSQRQIQDGLRDAEQRRLADAGIPDGKTGATVLGGIHATGWRPRHGPPGVAWS